jgi:DNA repair protein RadD
MKIFPSSAEVDCAVDILVNQLKVSPQLLGQLFGIEQRDQANGILNSLGGNRLTTEDVARLLVQRQGPELLTGSSNETKRLRLFLLKQISDEKIVGLFDRHASHGTRISTPARMRTNLSEKPWHAGKHWARDFVRSLELPAIFAGIIPESTVPTVIDISPLETPPKLAEFQVNLKTQMKNVLARDGARTRCVVTLPTGGGKTRIAVEAFIDWMIPRFAEGNYLIWVAQSEELCEQAIACIEQMWRSREFVSSLRIYRYFGGRSIQEDALQGGVVVASIHQLFHRVNSDDEILNAMLLSTGAMIIDEAHRSVSRMYDELLERASVIRGEELFPICGLTATPGRTGFNRNDETFKLVGRFSAYLVKPDLGKDYENNPLVYFRENGYLAQAHHEVFRSGRTYILTDQECDEIEGERDMSPIFLKRLAKDRRRNLRIVRRLLALPAGTSTLVYACTVEHAYFLSVILKSRERTSAAVSSETPSTLRRAMIDDFREKRIEFLCNYGVLTTGFDAPKVDCIVLCRPTTSEVLYEQIIGRGLRGPKFGGTEECKIIDFADNIGNLGPPLAYARFADFWTDEESVDN